jgi:hypothetical protein
MNDNGLPVNGATILVKTLSGYVGATSNECGDYFIPSLDKSRSYKVAIEAMGHEYKKLSNYTFHSGYNDFDLTAFFEIPEQDKYTNSVDGQFYKISKEGKIISVSGNNYENEKSIILLLLIDLYEKSGAASAEPIFVELGQESDPPNEVIRAFQAVHESAYLYSCAREEGGIYYLVSTEAEGSKLHIIGVSFKSDNEAFAHGTWYSGPLGSAGYNYFLNKDKGIWRIVKSVMTYIS